MEKKNANLDEDNKFCSKEENKDNNKKEVKNQIYNISYTEHPHVNIFQPHHIL